MNEMFNIMVTLETPDRGTFSKVSQVIGLLLAPYRIFMYLDYSGEGRWGEENIH